MSILKKSQSEEAKSLNRKLDKIQRDIYGLIDRIEELARDTIDKYVIEKIERKLVNIKNELIKLYSDLKTIAINFSPKPVFDTGVQLYGRINNQPDGAAFYEIASKFSSPIAKDYISRNGRKF